MKFGVREICDVVLRAKAAQRIGNLTFAKDEPVIYFDTAKTSTVEGAATTVYATGGSGNTRLIAWEGERTVTFTMEDALISPLGFAILSGAGIVDASEKAVNMHMAKLVEGTISADGITVDLTNYIPSNGALSNADIYGFLTTDTGAIGEKLGKGTVTTKTVKFTKPSTVTGSTGTVVVMVDFYISMSSGAQQIEITPDKFAGNYYLEASTLFRRQEDGVDMPAQFVIPNVKIQSAFTFSMASTGDPSTFTFTMDAFPDYTKFDKTKKVLFALQIAEDFQLV